MARGARAAVIIESGHAVVTPVGIAKLWALRRHVRVPLASITSVELADDPAGLRRGARMMGSWIPGYVTAGVFGFTKPRSFWVVGTSRPVVAFTTDGFRYARVVFSTDDPVGTKRKVERAKERGGG
jgi:hypothetical protein